MQMKRWVGALMMTATLLFAPAFGEAHTMQPEDVRLHIRTVVLGTQAQEIVLKSGDTLGSVRSVLGDDMTVMDEVQGGVRFVRYRYAFPAIDFIAYAPVDDKTERDYLRVSAFRTQAQDFFLASGIGVGSTLDELINDYGISDELRRHNRYLPFEADIVLDDIYMDHIYHMKDGAFTLIVTCDRRGNIRQAATMGEF